MSVCASLALDRVFLATLDGDRVCFKKSLVLHSQMWCLAPISIDLTFPPEEALWCFPAEHPPEEDAPTRSQC